MNTIPYFKDNGEMKGLKGFSIGYIGVCKYGYFSISVGL
jgi:hypothetical protein